MNVSAIGQLDFFFFSLEYPRFWFSFSREYIDGEMDEADVVIDELNQLVQELQDELQAKIEEIEKLTGVNGELREEVDVFTEQVVNFEEVHNWME